MNPNGTTPAEFWQCFPGWKRRDGEKKTAANVYKYRGDKSRKTCSGCCQFSGGVQ